MTDSDRDTQLLDAEIEAETVPESETESVAMPTGADEAAPDMEPLTAPPEPGPTGLSPDGATLAYLMPDDDGVLQLWLCPLDGSGPRRVPLDITLIEDRDGPQWSPDGASLALTGIHPEGNRSAIWLVDGESGEVRLLFDRIFPAHTPRWSPDGTTIAFVADRGGRETICVTPADGSGRITQLTDGLAGQRDREPVWSKEGDRVAFCRRTIEGTEPQVFDHIWTVSLETGETKQLTMKAAIRHSLRWGPERPLIVHVAEDGEWDHIAVVNADNSAGWTLASEAGDKEDPRWSPDGARVLYTRAQGGFIRCCDRATSAASAVLLDPGDGVVTSPRWLPDSRVVYAYATAGQPFRFIVQENKTDAERTDLPITDWQPGRTLTEPKPLEIQTGGGTKLNGLLYRTPEAAGLAPGVLYLADRPDQAPSARFHAPEQALAAAGYAVYAPILPGMRGLGRTIANSLKDQADTEAEVSDLADIAAKLRNTSGVDAEQIAVVGRGFGATLALLLAGARPGSVQAVVAIDPVSNWEEEFEHADDAWRAWLTRVYGLPLSQRGRYALRTPSTFVGVIDVPLLLLGTEHAPAHRATQLDELTTTLDDLGVRYQLETTADTDWEISARAASFLRDAIRGQWQPSEPVQAAEVQPEPANEVETAAPSEAVESEPETEAAMPIEPQPAVEEQTAEAPADSAPSNSNGVPKVPASDALRTDSV
jgi:dipeptidyl aminopeptidase/acylaminoacyl peptidase